MPNPQIENGYVKVANELVEQFGMYHFSGNEWMILWTVFRKTWGWNKKEDKISLTQFENSTRLSRPSVKEALDKLVGKRVLVVKKDTITHSYMINKNYLEWGGRDKGTSRVFGKKVVGKKVLSLVPIKVHTKDIIKDTITKDNTVSLFLEEFNSLFKRNYKPTAGRIKKLSLRLKSFTLEDILRATRNLAKSPFHRGVNDRGWTADPDFLLRSDEQIDKWINTDMIQARQLSILNKETKNAKVFAGTIQ